METWARTGNRPRLIRCLLLATLAVAFMGIIRPAHAASLRPSRLFWLARSTGWVHLRLDAIAQSAHVHLYVPASALISEGEAATIVGSFESRIFPTDTRIFGYPANLTPIDLALVPLDSVTLGYFDQNDIDPNGPGGDPAHSNHANVLFVRLPATMPDRDKLADTEEVLAHELQHLIEYRARVLQRHLAPEENWLNEGLSFFAQVANGFWTPRDVLKLDAACANPSWPVTSLNQSITLLSHSARIAYGRAGLFVTYLAARFGNRIASGLITSPDTGLAAVEDQVRAPNSRLSLATVYADWGVAQYLHAHRGAYGYGPFARNLRTVPALAFPTVTSYPFDSRSLPVSATTLRPWGQAYYQFETRYGRNLDLRVEAPGVTIRVAAVLEDSAHAVPPTVQWLHAQRDGSVSFRLNALASVYDRVTLMVNDEPADTSATAPGRIRVRAALVNVGNDDRASRLEASAGQDPTFTFRQILELGHAVSLRPADSEASPVPAGDA